MFNLNTGNLQELLRGKAFNGFVASDKFGNALQIKVDYSRNKAFIPLFDLPRRLIPSARKSLSLPALQIVLDTEELSGKFVYASECTQMRPIKNEQAKGSADMLGIGFRSIPYSPWVPTGICVVGTKLRFVPLSVKVKLRFTPSRWGGLAYTGVETPSKGVIIPKVRKKRDKALTEEWEALKEYASTRYRVLSTASSSAAVDLKYGFLHFAEAVQHYALALASEEHLSLFTQHYPYIPNLIKNKTKSLMEEIPTYRSINEFYQELEDLVMTKTPGQLPYNAVNLIVSSSYKKELSFTMVEQIAGDIFALKHGLFYASPETVRVV